MQSIHWSEKKKTLHTPKLKWMNNLSSDLLVRHKDQNKNNNLLERTEFRMNTVNPKRILL